MWWLKKKVLQYNDNYVLCISSMHASPFLTTHILSTLFCPCPVRKTKNDMHGFHLTTWNLLTITTICIIFTWSIYKTPVYSAFLLLSTTRRTKHNTACTHTKNSSAQWKCHHFRQGIFRCPKFTQTVTFNLARKFWRR